VAISQRLARAVMALLQPRAPEGLWRGILDPSTMTSVGRSVHGSLQ